MFNNDRIVKGLLFLIVLLLAIVAFQPYVVPIETVHAQTARFDHVTVVSALFLHGGDRGLLLLDRRNGNVWFMPSRGETYRDPVFLVRVPFEKLDRQP